MGPGESGERSYQQRPKRALWSFQSRGRSASLSPLQIKLRLDNWRSAAYHIHDKRTQVLGAVRVGCHRGVRLAMCLSARALISLSNVKDCSRGLGKVKGQKN